MKVAVEGGVVKYYRNSTLLYTSTVAPIYPLKVDASLNTVWSALYNVVLSGASLTASPVNYVFQDVQGSTRAVMSGTSVVARHDFLPFGEEISSGTGMRTSGQGFGAADKIRQRYGLTERDDATGLDHTWWRKYENRAGRWTSADPYLGSMNMANPQSFNRYAYVQNDPVNFVDPTGLDPGYHWNPPPPWWPAPPNQDSDGGGSVLGDDPSFRIVDPPTDAPTGGDVGGGQQNPTPPSTTCGVNPATGTPGFSRNPMGQPGHLRASIGGDGWFGARRPRQRSGRHAGLDIAGVLNTTPVVAFLPGTITFAGHTPGDGGTLVNIDHGNGITSSYVHLQRGSIPSGLVPTRANPAPQVAQGQRIGTLGNSGNAGTTPPHVHFWIKQNGVLQNPETFLNQPCPP